eukprot:2039171-Prymnesium_polylepis.2
MARRALRRTRPPAPRPASRRCRRPRHASHHALLRTRGPPAVCALTARPPSPRLLSASLASPSLRPLTASLAS